MSPQTARPAIDLSDLAVNGAPPISNTSIGVISVTLTEADIDAAVSVLRSGMLAQGPHVAEFEERFAKITGAKHAVACANGTCALQLAYGVLINPGDEVLVPAWGYIATASMIVAAGAKPIFCDADPTTYNIDPQDAARKITSRTTAIAATHLYGAPVDINRFDALAKERDLHIIYDAAQSHLATFNNTGLGAFGDAVTYSFYPTKNMTTGEGGMVTTNDQEVANRLRQLRSHGETEKYVHGTIGFNYRMTDLEAAIGVSQLSRLPDLTGQRQHNARAHDAAIAKIEGLHAPVTAPNSEHAYHLYAVRMEVDRFKCTRDEFCAALKAEGVGSAIHYPRSLTRQPVFASEIADHPPVADRLAESLFCIPVHPALSEQEVALVGEALAKVAAAYRM